MAFDHSIASQPSPARPVLSLFRRLTLFATLACFSIGVDLPATVPTVPAVLDAELKQLLSNADLLQMRGGLRQRLVGSYERMSNKEGFIEDGARVRLLLLCRFLRSFPEDELRFELATEEGRRFLLGIAVDDVLLKGCFGYDLASEVPATWPKGALAGWVRLRAGQGVQERAKFGVMAAACAYSLSGNKVIDYNGKRCEASQVYAWLKASAENSAFVVSPEVLTFDELCLLAVVPRSTEEMDYLRRSTRKSRWGELADNCWRVKYTLVNKEGVSVHDSAAFYGGRPATVDVLEKMGGVCGAISKFGVAACRARGVPATAVGQPGHCAFVWLSSDFKWQLSNDVSGWAKTGGAGEGYGGIQMLSPWGAEGPWLRVVERLRLQPGALRAHLLMESADVLGEQACLKQLKQATLACPAHPTVWRRLYVVVPQSEKAKVLESAKKSLSVYPPEVFEWVGRR